jgi:hypothetical protein
VGDRFGVWARFDEEERNHTHGERVVRCSRCAALPDARAPSPAHEKVRSGQLRPVGFVPRISQNAGRANFGEFSN